MLVEHHEDVVLIKPAQVADPTSARFFFHQVKNVSGKAWTAKNLTNRPKAKKNLKNSVLGKLIQGTHGQPFSDQLDSILIVATCGFSLPQVKPNQQYQELGHADLTPEVQKQLREAMETELGHPVDLTRLRLLKPTLGENYIAGVVLAIVDLVAKKMPNAKSNPRYIYQNLIDELHRRGVIQHDYQSWEKLLGEKGLSGVEIEKTLRIHSTAPQDDPIGAHIKEVGEKLGLSIAARIRLPDAASAYYRRRKFTNSLDQLRVNSELSAAVAENWSLVEEDKLIELSEAVRGALSSDSLTYLASFEGFNAAVACEIIISSLGEIDAKEL